jgi:hypothetical protein
MRTQGQSSSKLTAREVVARIKKNIGVPWRTPTADEFKTGDPEAPISLLVFESREWEAAEYVRDAIAAGQRKALIHFSLLPFQFGNRPPFWSNFFGTFGRRAGNSEPCRFEANLGGQICATLLGSIYSTIPEPNLHQLGRNVQTE